MIALCAAAFAASIAVVDLEGPLPHEVTVAASEALREAFLTDGRLSSVSGLDIADGVSAQDEAALREGRDAAAEARRLWLGGDPEAALPRAEAAVSAHVQALSHVGRRAELADAWFLVGVCNAELGATSEAQAAFSRVLTLVPDYAQTRATRVGGVALEALSSARPDGWVLEEAVLARVRARLGVDWVLSGRLNEDGELTLMLTGEGGASLISGSLGAPQTVVARTFAQTLATADEPAEVGPRRLTERWWFWTGTAAVLGGAGALGYALWEPAPVEVQGPDTYSVRVE